jgi:hypothetical protein
MTILDSLRRAGPFTGNGATTTFPCDFKIIDAGDLTVTRVFDATGVVTTLTLGGDYTLTGVGGDSASIVLAAPLAVGYRLVAVGSAAYTQALQLTNQGPYFAEDVMRALDRGVVLIQQLREAVSRALVLPPQDAGTIPLLGDVILDMQALAPIAGDISAVSAIVAEITAVAAQLDDILSAVTAAAEAAASAELARVYSLQAGSYFTETDAAMSLVLIPPEIDVLTRRPASASLDQVAVVNELSTWVRVTLPTSQPYFTTSGGTAWAQDGYRESQVLSVVHSALQGAYGSIRHFATRADALTWVSLNPAPAVGTMLHWEGISVYYDGVNTGLPAPALAGYSPANDVLNLKHTASASSLASDFAGVMAQAIADAASKKWKLLVPKGNWATQPIVYDFLAAASLDIEFAQGAKLIGPAQFQHFAGNGVLTSFTLTNWTTASTDVLVAMKVSAANVETVLTFADAVNGFTRSGAIVTVGSAVTIATGETLVVCASNSILKITGENGDVRLRLRGGYFDNGAMGYVLSQAAGTCVNLQTIRGLDWDGAPIFSNTSKKSWMDLPLLRRGDSGLVLANVEQANIRGAVFEYQPDLGVYITGLARGTPPETYYIDDGRMINLFGCHALGCDTAYRTARKGGGAGFYGNTVTEGSSGIIADDVSSGGLGASRNIIIQGLIGRKIGRDMLDIRGVNSCVISGVAVEDWGRKPDGTVVNTRPLFSFGAVKHLHASGIVARYEEWTPPATPQAVVSFNGGRTIVDKFEARIERPYASIGDGSVGVVVTGAIGALSYLPLDLTTINVDTPLSLPGSSVDNAVTANIAKITHDGSSIFTVSKWRVANARIIPETTGVPLESTGVAVVPTLTMQTPNGAVVTATGSSTGKYIREGNMVHAKLSMQVNVTWGTAPTGFIRMTWGAGQLPDVGEIFATHVSFWNSTNPLPSNVADISVFRSAVNQLSFRFLNEAGTNTILDAAAFFATTSTFFRIDLSFSYAVDGLI